MAIKTRIISLAFLLITGLHVLAAPRILMQVDGIPGESTVAGYTNWIDVSSFGSELINESAKNIHNGIAISKEVDVASPSLQAWTASGMIRTKVELHFLEANRSLFYKVVLSNVTARTIVTSLENESTDLVEALVMDFNQIKWTYRQLDQAGVLKDKSSTFWNPTWQYANYTTNDLDQDGIADMADEDLENDGIPNAWEAAHGGNQFTDDRDTDQDGDGFTHQQEFAAGTSSDDPDDFFQVSYAQLSASKAELRWKSAPGKSYTIMRSASVTGPYHPWSGPISSAGSTEISRKIDVGPTHFYYLVVEP